MASCSPVEETALSSADSCQSEKLLSTASCLEVASLPIKGPIVNRKLPWHGFPVDQCRELYSRGLSVNQRNCFQQQAAWKWVSYQTERNCLKVGSLWRREAFVSSNLPRCGFCTLFAIRRLLWWRVSCYQGHFEDITKWIKAVWNYRWYR